MIKLLKFCFRLYKIRTIVFKAVGIPKGKYD